MQNLSHSGCCWQQQEQQETHSQTSVRPEDRLPVSAVPLGQGVAHEALDGGNWWGKGGGEGKEFFCFSVKNMGNSVFYPVSIPEGRRAAVQVTKANKANKLSIWAINFWALPS